MAAQILVCLEDQLSATAKRLLRLVGESRKIDLVPSIENSVPPRIPANGLLQQLLALSSVLLASEHPREAGVLNDVHTLTVALPDFGGLGFTNEQILDLKEESEVFFLVSAYMESLNSAERSRASMKPLQSRPVERRGMTLSEKIFAAHDIERRGEVKPGDVVRVDVDWILSSELAWGMGMERIYNDLGRPGIFRNDRFWLAGDHMVDPSVMDHPRIKPLVEASERAREAFKLTEYQGMNYTIMHTEFCRERAQSGMLVIGSDSHTCSAGSVGSLAIGLGVADVTLPLITGQTWFRIPESINVQFTNRPGPGIGGKDIVLYILKQLKRNTVASDRVVEYSGPGLKYLTVDARFAIANMTTEFGGVTGIFVPDQVTCDYMNQRKNAKYKRNAVFFSPDGDAEYASTHIIDLSEVESFVARYPAPDDVVSVIEVEGMALDGCFIGACTTTEEDLVLAAFVLKEGLRRGMRPVKHGKRKVVPGSRPILHKLRKLDLINVYEMAGFEVGVPGCSYCVGMSADKAVEGEVWLSSQNRNFENRMGKGAFGNLASAVTVAASSFQMQIANPKFLLDAVDLKKFREALGLRAEGEPSKAITYVEPGGNHENPLQVVRTALDVSRSEEGWIAGASSAGMAVDALVRSRIDPVASWCKSSTTSKPAGSARFCQGRVQRLGDFIDTDALAPTEAILNATTPEQFGRFCLIYTHPSFRERVRQGRNIVVAGEAFGCGSSRDVAVTALIGAGVKCVIAKSFAFIYGRNQPNLGLLGITITESRFYEVAVDEVDIMVDLERSVIEVENNEGDVESFDFHLSQMERQLIECGGITKAFGTWGNRLWERLFDERPQLLGQHEELPVQPGKGNLQW